MLADKPAAATVAVKNLAAARKYAGTNKATAVTWTVGPDVEGVLAALKSKGASSSITTCPASRSTATSSASSADRRCQ